MAVYILTFDTPLGNPHNPRGSASTYIGYANDLRIEERMKEHLAGRGAAITRAAVERGIEIKIAVIIPLGDRTLERKLKNQKNTRRIIKKYEKLGAAGGYYNIPISKVIQ